MMFDDILILGTIPPPIGGVTVHVQRLLKMLDKNGIPYHFIPLKRNVLKIILFELWKYPVVHLHCSNVYFRFFFSLWCYLLHKKLLITYHGNIGRYNQWKNILDIWSISLAYVPIVLNESSLDIAKQYNRRACLISAFLPPEQEEPLSSSLEAQLDILKNSYKTIFSTNASTISYDSKNNEIYGIFSLIDLFKFYKDKCLVISDPSGAYIEYLNAQKINIPNNILLVSYPHSYYSLLEKVDCMIRNTTTDGDALSIKEALYLHKMVFATDVVDRHPAVYTYHTMDELGMLIDSAKPPLQKICDISGKEKLLQLYKNVKARVSS